MLSAKKKHALRLYTYLATFFFTVHAVFTAYVNSTFLNQFLSNDAIGLIYSLGSLIALVGIFLLPDIFKHLGITPIIKLLGVVMVASTLVLAFHEVPVVLVSAFVVYYSFGFWLKYCLDIYLEELSDDRITGGIRGLYMTIINIAWLLSPILSMSLAEKHGFGFIYLIASIAAIPFLGLFMHSLPEIPIRNMRGNVWKTITNIWDGKTLLDRNVGNILIIDFLLNFFYGIMVIYLPLMIADRIDLSLTQTGLLLTIMLLPFTLFEYPLGVLADKTFGEKEFLGIGLVILGLATYLIPHLPLTSLAAWAAILFMTRVGASFVEIMKETYLFKIINKEDIAIIGISRANIAFGALIASLLASTLLHFELLDLPTLFGSLGAIMLIGLIYVLPLKDTK